MELTPEQAVTAPLAQDSASPGVGSSSPLGELAHGPETGNGSTPAATQRTKRGPYKKKHVRAERQPRNDYEKQRDTAAARARRERKRLAESQRLAGEDALRRDAAELREREKLDELRDFVEERRPPTEPAAAPPSSAAPPDAPAPTPPPQSPPRPGWPSDAAIAEAAPVASMLVTVLGALAAAAGAPFLNEELEIPVRGADGVRKLVKVDAYSALTEAVAPVVAKHSAIIADTPEAQLATVAAAIFLPRLAPVALKFARAKFPGLDSMLSGVMEPASAPRAPLQVVPNAGAQV